MIRSSRDTGKLTIKSKDVLISLYFKEGVLVNAEGDRTPIATVEKLVLIESGDFEFVKLTDVTEFNEKERLQQIIANPSKTKEEWATVKKKFPIYGISFNITETQSKDEIVMTKEEWNLLLIMRAQRNLALIIKASPYGELETLKLLASLFDKQLVSISLSDDDTARNDDSVIPIRERGWAALTTPINGRNNLAFYNKIDDEKDFITICKELNISLSEGRNILKYLFEKNKIGLKKNA
jgi:hypothetical protein